MANKTEYKSNNRSSILLNPVGGWPIVAIIIVAGALLITFVVVNIANEFESGGDGSTSDILDSTCYTKCTWFTEKNCENNEFVSFCFGMWGCGDGWGRHVCVEK